MILRPNAKFQIIDRREPDANVTATFMKVNDVTTFIRFRVNKDNKPIPDPQSVEPRNHQLFDLREF